MNTEFGTAGASDAGISRPYEKNLIPALMGTPSIQF
jgi:hypothetical protein